MDLETELLKIMNPDELEQEVSNKIKAFHSLLTREASLRLIAKEKGILKTEEKTYKLKEIPEGTKKVKILAKVKKVWPIATYASGKSSRVLELIDDSGSRSILLWNQDTQLANNLRTGDSLEIGGVYERNGELHLGFSGEIKTLSKAGFLNLNELSDTTHVHVRAFIVQISDSILTLENETGSKVLCVFEDNSDRISKLKVGDELIIEDVSVKDGQIIVSKSSRLLSRRKDELLCGSINSLDSDDEKLLAMVGERQISLDRENAMRFLGVSVADDLSLSTIVTLKKPTLLNKNVALKIEEKQGQIFIR